MTGEAAMSEAAVNVDQGSRLVDDTTPSRPPAGAKLSRTEADDLEWFFGVAPSRFARSTSGGIFDRIETMSAHEIMKAGYQYGRPSTEKVYGADGHTVIGHRDGTTARPTAEYRSSGGFEPDDHSVKRFARISRSVEQLGAGDGTEDGREMGEMHVAVFRTYFGDVGNVWEWLSVNGGVFEVAKDHATGDVLKDERGQTLLRKVNQNVNAGHRAHGRIGSLYALTRGGTLLLRYSAKLAKKRGQPWYDFGDQVRLQLELRGATKINAEQVALVGRARREATALFVSACFAWNRVRKREV